MEMPNNFQDKHDIDFWINYYSSSARNRQKQLFHNIYSHPKRDDIYTLNGSECSNNNYIWNMSDCNRMKSSINSRVSDNMTMIDTHQWPTSEFEMSYDDADLGLLDLVKNLGREGGGSASTNGGRRENSHLFSGTAVEANGIHTNHAFDTAAANPTPLPTPVPVSALTAATTQYPYSHNINANLFSHFSNMYPQSALLSKQHRLNYYHNFCEGYGENEADKIREVGIAGGSIGLGLGLGLGIRVGTGAGAGTGTGTGTGNLKSIVGCDEDNGYYMSKRWKEHGSITDSNENHIDDDDDNDDTMLQYQENLLNCNFNPTFSINDNDEDKMVDVVRLSETSEHCNEYDLIHYSKEYLFHLVNFVLNVNSENDNQNCFGINENGLFKKTMLNGSYPFNNNLITDHYSSSSKIKPYKNTLLLPHCQHQHPIIKEEEEEEEQIKEEEIETESMRYGITSQAAATSMAASETQRRRSYLSSGRYVGEDMCWHSKTNNNNIKDIQRGIISQNLHNKGLVTSRGSVSTFKRKRSSKKDSELNINNTQSQSIQSQHQQPQQSQQYQRRKHKQHKPWRLEETIALVEGVELCGGGRWAEIKRLGKKELCDRSPVDLKDKWRNLLKAAYSPNSGLRSNGTVRKGDSRTMIPQYIWHKIRRLSAMKSKSRHE